MELLPLSSERLKALLTRLSDERWDLRVGARKELVELGSASVQGLLQVLAEGSENAQVEAIIALGELRAEAAVPALVNTLRDAPTALQRLAASNLSTIGGEAAITALLESLQDTAVRDVSAEGLARVGLTTTLPALREALRSARSSTDYQAYLTRFRLASAIRALDGALDDESRSALKEVVLKAFHGRHAWPDFQVRALEALLADNAVANSELAALLVGGSVDPVAVRAAGALAERRHLTSEVLTVLRGASRYHRSPNWQARLQEWLRLLE